MGKIPQLVAEGEILPETWEKSLELLHDKGIRNFKESYRFEENKIGILESSMKIVVHEPLKEPMLHSACNGLPSLPSYVEEVLKGTKDRFIGKAWDYTYHERLFLYRPISLPRIDQVDSITKRLKEAHYSNRAQAVTWMPWKDTGIGGPPCLQRIWCKVVDDELEMHTSWRSRDGYEAAFMNMYALVHLQKMIADSLNVKVGQYVDDSDSYHVYENRIIDFERAIKTIRSRRNQGLTNWKDSSVLSRL
jgi:thymidylate synthase